MQVLRVNKENESMVIFWMKVMFKFIKRAPDGPGLRILSCFQLINKHSKDGSQTLQTLHIMYRSVFHVSHLQENIFADDEGSSICY